jgi:hypothetical protein
MQQLNIINKWQVPMPLNGNVFVYGKLGSGKSCKLLTFAQLYFEHRFKVWDLFGGSRQEGGFWCFPNDDYKIWEQLEHETYEFTERGPKQYKVNMLYPMFSKKMKNKKLPQNPPYVKSKIFTLPISQIEEEDLEFVFGELGTRAKTIWQKIEENTTKKSNGEDIKHLMNTKLKKGRNDALYNLLLHPLIENNLITSENCELNLDLVEEAKQRDVVTVLNLDFVPERFKFFFIGYITRRLTRLTMANKIHKKNIGLYREANMFMKLVDAKKSRADVANILRNQINDSARYARSGFFIFMDTQSSSEVKGLVEGQEQFLGLCEISEPATIEQTCVPLLKQQRISRDQIIYLSQMKVHQIIISMRGKKAEILNRIQPPRCRYWKREYGNFFSLWRKLVDKWMNANAEIDKVVDEYDMRSLELEPEEEEAEEIETPEDEKSGIEEVNIQVSKKGELSNQIGRKNANMPVNLPKKPVEKSANETPKKPKKPNIAEMILKRREAIIKQNKELEEKEKNG